MVTTLQPEAGRARTVYFDKHRDAPKGFCLRVTKHGRSFYLLRSSKQHGRLWIHIGDAKAIALDKARELAEKRAARWPTGRTGRARRARSGGRTGRQRPRPSRLLASGR
jgi:hypothetical protein